MTFRFHAKVQGECRVSAVSFCCQNGSQSKLFVKNSLYGETLVENRCLF